MPGYRVRVRLTYSANLYIEADSKEEVKRIVKSGEWEDEPQLDELVDWGDQHGYPESIEEDE